MILNATPYDLGLPRNAIVSEKWPGPRVWWSGSMRRNPGNEADGWTLPSEHDMRQFAEVVR